MGAISFTELVTEVGGASSNSYGTLDELKAYFANRDEAAELLAEGDSVLIARMIQATLINDTVLKAYGFLASDTQSLEFPRKELVDKHGRSYADDRFLSLDDDISIYHYVRKVTGDENYTKENIENGTLDKGRSM